MELSIRRIKSSDGERFVILADKNGTPLFYPTLYVTVHMRGRSLAVNTVENSLIAIKALYIWQAYYGLDLELRFSRGDFLRSNEIHALRDFMQKPLVLKEQDKVASISGRCNVVSVSNQYARLSVLADYLGFLAKQLQSSSKLYHDHVERMVSQIKANRPKKPTKSNQDRDEKHLDDSVLDSLEKALKPGSENNPAKEYAVQVRNALMFSIMRLTGLRRGELLNLKVEDIDFAKNTLKVVRRPDAKDDIRTFQPVAKTRERTIPLIPELINRIYEYVLKYRNNTSAAKKHGYLLVTHKEGASLGQPISNAAFGKFMADLKKIADNHDGIHAHALRHHWNYAFSKACESKGVTPEREEKIRSYLMGWSETSGTAATYNRRHIKEQANRAALELQNKYLGIKTIRDDE